MPAVIRTTLEDNSKQWAGEIKKNFSEVETSSQDVALGFQTLNEELDAHKTAKFTEEIRQVSQGMDETAEATRNLSEETKQIALDQQFNQWKQMAEQFGNSLASISDALEAFNQELASIKAKQLASETQKAADAIEECSTSAKKSSAFFQALEISLKKVHQAYSSIVESRFSKGLQSLTSGFGMAKEVVGNLSEGIRYLGDNGSVSMKGLSDSFDAVTKACIAATDDPQFSHFVDSITSGINTLLIPAIESIPTALRSTQDILPLMIAGTGEWFRIFEEGTTNTIREQAQLRESLIETEKQQAASAAYLQNANKILEAEESRMNKSREAAALSQITDLQTLERMRAEQSALYQKLTREEKASTEELTEAASKLTQIRNRILATQAAEEKRLVEEIRKSRENQEKAARDAANAELKRIKEIEEAEKAAQIAMHKERVKAHQAHLKLLEAERIEALKQAEHEEQLERQKQKQNLDDFMAFLTAKQGMQSQQQSPPGAPNGIPGQGPFQQGPLQQGAFQQGANKPSVQPLTPQQIRGILKNRQKEDWENFLSNLQKNNLVGADGESMTELSKQGKPMRHKPLLRGADAKKHLELWQKQSQSKVKKQFRKDMALGKVTHTDVAKLNNNVRDAALKKIESDGSLKDSEIQLLREMVERLNEANRRNAALEDMLRSLHNALNSPLRGPGSHKKGQAAVP